jgi:hypothetical protein
MISTPARLPLAALLGASIAAAPALSAPLLAAPTPATGAVTAAPESGATAGRQETSDLASLRNDAVAAYNRQDYGKAASIATRYAERARSEGRTGREFAAVSFILGHSRYEMHRKNGGPYDGDYRAEVVEPLEESLRILQDDPAFKNMLLGNAYFELWTLGGRRDADDEDRAQWYLLKSILVRQDEVADRPRDGAEYDLFARHLLFYLERCLDLAQDSPTPDLYLWRVRAMAPAGFGTAYDARFWQIYDLTYFDGGTMQAAAPWQRALDAMRDPKADPDAVLATFTRAADRTRYKKDRAEIYRQMADFVSTIDEPERRTQAAEFARKAYGLDPGDAEIRRQFGSALHLLSYAAYSRGAFPEALRQAREAASFEWEGMEIASFDLSRAAAELGQESDALTHGERAYRMAKEKGLGSDLQPFAQNYVNILRQFGQDALAARVQKEEAALGVR